MSTPLPMLPDGTVLGAMQLTSGSGAKRFVYAEPEVLEWLRMELLKKNSTGMPRQQGGDPLPNWK